MKWPWSRQRDIDEAEAVVAGLACRTQHVHDWSTWDVIKSQSVKLMGRGAKPDDVPVGQKLVVIQQRTCRDCHYVEVDVQEKKF